MKTEFKAGEVVLFGRDILRCVRSFKVQENEDIPLGTSDGCCVISDRNDQKVLFLKIGEVRE